MNFFYKGKQKNYMFVHNKNETLTFLVHMYIVHTSMLSFLRWGGLINKMYNVNLVFLVCSPLKYQFFGSNKQSIPYKTIMRVNKKSGPVKLNNSPVTPPIPPPHQYAQGLRVHCNKT